MFIRDGQRFSARDYYRDDAAALSVLRFGRLGPVLVTGLAGIGKSWFLRRIEELAAATESRHFDDKGAPSARSMERTGFEGAEHQVATEEGEAALLARLARPEPRRLLLVDGLDARADGPARHALLAALGRYRGPLVLAATPALRQAIDAAFVDRCRSLVLPPLTPPERRALLLQTREPGAGVAARYAELGLEPGWGGHPRVLTTVGTILRDPTASTVARLGDVAWERLGGYGAAVAASCSPLERAALFAVARGEGVVEALRGAALSLTLHGALVRRGGAWVIENRVLGRSLVGAC